MKSNKKIQINIEKIVIKELFSNFWLRVPNYQRPYVWGKDEIFELIDDINNARKDNLESDYFLGSMVLFKTFKDQDGVQFDENELIDGQQRLTTLMLMLACIRDKALDNKLKMTCHEMLFPEKNEFKHTPDRNRIIYETRDEIDDFINDFIKHGSTFKLIKKVNDADSTSKRLKNNNNLSIINMKYAIQTIHNCFDDTKLFIDYDNFTKFVIYLLNKVLLIYVSVEDLDDAFRIFTIINDRGIPLSNSDILKSKNLCKVTNDSERMKWAKYWEEAEEEMGRDDFDRLLSMVRTIYIKDRKYQRSLIKDFDERIYGANPPLLEIGVPTFEVLKAYKNAFDTTILLYMQGSKGKLYSLYSNRVNIMRKGFTFTDWIPPVLVWYRKFNTEKLYNFISSIDNKFSADWILQCTPSQRFNYMNRVIKAIEKAVTSDEVLDNKELFDVNCKELLKKLDDNIYDEHFAKYILLRLEYLKADHNIRLNLPDKLIIERILPKDPIKNSEWLRDFTNEQQKLWLNRLGNLILLTRNRKTGVQTLNFAEKQKKYFENYVENLPNSQSVLELKKFTLAEIKFRQATLVKQLGESYGCYDFISVY